MSDYTPTTEEMICSYCGKKMIAAESMINNKYFCHTFSDEYPTCYMRVSRGENSE